MSKAHVPPRAAGNTGKVTSSVVRIIDGTMGHGRANTGGLWVRGLCRDCNSLAGADYDTPYADFARRVTTFGALSQRMYLQGPSIAPAVWIAPGLVARSVLFGMFALNPQLRVVFPELASALLNQEPHVTMPQGGSLRLALYGGDKARIAGPQSAHRVLVRREGFVTFAEVFFKPAAWVLAPTNELPIEDETIVFDQQGWADVSEWLEYGPDVTAVDLRNLVASLPTIAHPLDAARNDWIEMLSDEISPVLEGSIPS